MNTKSPAISNSTDLVLQLAGGERNGQLLPVTTAKCLLSSLIADKAEAEKYRCAIFRGEKGVAFRSYNEHVLVNGAKTSVQWLKEGDTIQLTPEMNVVVKQLGTFEPNKAATPSKAPLPAVRQGENTIAMPSTAVGTPDSEMPVNTKPVDTPISASEQTPVTSTKDQNLGQRVDALSDQLTSLVDAASESGAVPTTAGLTNQPAPQTPAGEPLSDKKMADASSSIQDYLDKALASTGTGSIASPTPMPQTPVVAPATTESRRTEATVEFPETVDASPASSASENAATLRKEEVTSSLNRLLSGTDNNPVSQDRVAQPSDITAMDQSSDATKTDSVLLPNPTQPTTAETSDFLTAGTESPAAAPVEASPATQLATETVDEATASVDAPKAQSLDFLKSLGIDAEELGIKDKTPAQESTTSELTQSVSDASREEAPSAVLPTADEIIASASMGSAVEAVSDSIVPAEVVDEEEASEPVAQPKKAESVADVLARMQNAGSLDSFSMDGPTEETSSEPVVGVTAEVAPPKPQVSETVVADTSMKSESGGDEDNSVEDYMSQLLNRMRGGEDAEETEDKKPDAEKPAPKKEEAKAEVVEAVDAQPQQEPLTAEQFVPKQKAVRMKSFDSLREIANNSNRLAIQDHLANQRKVSTQTKLQLALISLGFGVLFFAMACLFSTHVSIGGMFCGLVFLICGVVFGKFYRDERKLDESIIKAQKEKA